MSKSVDRYQRICLVLSALFVLAAPAADTPRAQTSADARLRALYTEEWKWRQQEVAGNDQYAIAAASNRFPRVDPASQQARLAYWTRTLAALDAIPFDQLSAEEKVNAEVFRASVRGLANDVRFKTYEAPFNSDTFFWTEFTPRQGFTYGSIVLSRPMTDTRGTVKPRARPARMLAICSSK